MRLSWSAILIMLACAAWGQDYPSRPLRVITAGVGGGSDFAARLISQALAPRLGQPVIVDNRGLTAMEAAAKATPDGYTLLLNGSAIWLVPFMRTSVAWDPIRDFAPITLAITSPNMVVVHTSVAAKSIKELIGLAKTRPGEINYATSGTGNTTHISAELFRVMAGIDVVRVNYKSAGSALNDLLAGQVQLMFPNAAAMAPHLKSGKLRGLAVTSAEPSALAPGLPTVAGSGVPGYESVSVNAIFAPAGTRSAIVQRLNQEIIQVLRTPEVKERFLSAGVETVGTTPQQLATTVNAEMARLGKLIKDAGIRDE